MNPAPTPTPEIKTTEEFSVQGSRHRRRGDISREFEEAQLKAFKTIAERFIDADREDLLCRLHFQEIEPPNAVDEIRGRFSVNTNRDATRSEWASYYLSRLIRKGCREWTNGRLLKTLERVPTGDEMKELDPEGKLLAIAIHETQRRQAIAFLKTQPPS